MNTSKPARWFRMYAEFATDPKVQMMPEVMQRRFVMLLCLRCGNGNVTLQDEEVAFQLRISNDEWLQTKAYLIDKGLIDDVGLPTNWDKRQYASDSSAERVARHREKKKQACNVTVTPPEKEKEKETKSKPKGDSLLFEAFWQAYPNKKARAAAQKAFDKLKVDQQLIDTILSAIQSQTQSEDWTKDNGRFIPYPATWLNQTRWLDEVEPQTAWANSIFAGAK